TLVGAWWLAGSAVRPVYEITEQATRIEAGTLGQRIMAHADTDEYRGLVAVLNRMLERIDAAFENQRRLTADVSHELRSPLTALRGEIEVALRAERSPRDYQRVLRSGLEEIDRLTAMSEDLLLTVGKSGPPLAEDELAHLFDPFSRADQARTRGTGTGLGLAVAAAVTSVHGGLIRGVNVPSGGVRLECELVGMSHARHAA